MDHNTEQPDPNDTCRTLEVDGEPIRLRGTGFTGQPCPEARRLGANPGSKNPSSWPAKSHLNHRGINSSYFIYCRFK